MENTNNNIPESGNNGTVEPTTTTTNTENMVSMTKEDFDKKIQSETDKVRTEYSKKVKELEAKISELTPVQKTEAELDFEKRLANLEAREKSLNLSESLRAKGINTELTQYLRDDVDVDKLATLIDATVSAKMTANGYVPEGHKSAESMTKEEFRKLPMDKKEELYMQNRELYKALTAK